jgi:hypothetical protein
MFDNKASIVIHSDTREYLKSIGRKSQTYDDIIKELLGNQKKYDSVSSAKRIESAKS